MQTEGEDLLEDDYFTDKEVAVMFGVNHVTVRKWRVKNKTAGFIKYGPPYEYRGANVVYPKTKFREWCAQVRVINGVPHLNLPRSACPVQRSTVNTTEGLRATQ